MLSLLMALVVLAGIVVAACTVHILGCVGRLLFWIFGIIGITLFLFLLL